METYSNFKLTWWTNKSKNNTLGYRRDPLSLTECIPRLIAVPVTLINIHNNNNNNKNNDNNNNKDYNNNQKTMMIILIIII